MANLLLTKSPLPKVLSMDDSVSEVLHNALATTVPVLEHAFVFVSSLEMLHSSVSKESTMLETPI